MGKPKNIRGLVSLALQRHSEGELRSFHRMICEMSPNSFINLVRDIEDELSESFNHLFDETVESGYNSYESENFYRELDRIRRIELNLSVQSFSELLHDSILYLSSDKTIILPKFDQRRGMRIWLEKVIKIIPESLVYNAAMRILLNKKNSPAPDWKLR